MRTLLGTALLALLIGGCSAPLAERDPNGYEACSLLSEARQDVGVAGIVSKTMTAGESAMKSSTEAIRETAEPLLDEEAMEALEGTDSEGINLVNTDADALAKACQDEGFDMPEAR